MSFVTLDSTAIPADTAYTHYCAHCAVQLRRARATENRQPHRCDEEGLGIFDVAFGEELRPVRWAADLVEVQDHPEDDDLPGSICAGGPD